MRTPSNNTDLDYALCSLFGITIDTLDRVPLKYVEQMREREFATWPDEDKT